MRRTGTGRGGAAVPDVHKPHSRASSLAREIERGHEWFTEENYRVLAQAVLNLEEQLEAARKDASEFATDAELEAQRADRLQEQLEAERVHRREHQREHEQAEAHVTDLLEQLEAMRDALVDIAGYGISPNNGYPVVSADVVKKAKAVLASSPASGHGGLTDPAEQENEGGDARPHPASSPANVPASGHSPDTGRGSEMAADRPPAASPALESKT